MAQQDLDLAEQILIELTGLDSACVDCKAEFAKIWSPWREHGVCRYLGEEYTVIFWQFGWIHMWCGSHGREGLPQAMEASYTCHGIQPALTIHAAKLNLHELIGQYYT